MQDHEMLDWLERGAFAHFVDDQDGRGRLSRVASERRRRLVEVQVHSQVGLASANAREPVAAI